MTRKYFIVFSLLLSFVTFGTTVADAQKRKKVTKAPVLSEVELERQARIEEMQYAAQKIVFIDSIVVDKDQMLTTLRLPSEAGTFTTSDRVFGTDAKSGTVFVNEIGDKCYFSQKDAKGNSRIYSADWLDGHWTAPMQISGFEELGDSIQIDYPFMLADGTTLYLAMRGEESIGGYDIFVTRYNAEGNSFFKPENIGMPFNSVSNDYFYVVDEYDNIGWFATDRNQPKDKVCIYTFIPTESRETYSDVSESKLCQLASLHSIADTWGDGIQRQKALQRIEDINARLNEADTDAVAHSMSFVVCDNVVYTSATQFKADGNRQRYSQLLDMKHQYEVIGDQLERSRQRYAQSDSNKRQTLQADILASEQQLEQLELQIRQLEKEIRYAENKEIFP